MQSTKVDDSLTVAGQIGHDDIAALAQQGFGTIINNRPDDEEPGQMSQQEAAAEAARRGLEYHYIPVVTGAITREQITAFHNAVRRSAKPVLAHCRSGTRCYLLWGASRVLFEGESALKIVAQAALKGYDLRILPRLIDKLENEG